METPTPQKNGTFRLNDLKYYGLMERKFYAVIENNRIQSFKSKKHSMQNGLVCKLNGFGKHLMINGTSCIEVITDKGTFIAKHCQGVMLA